MYNFPFNNMAYSREKFIFAALIFANHNKDYSVVKMLTGGQS